MEAESGKDARDYMDLSFLGIQPQRHRVYVFGHTIDKDVILWHPQLEVVGMEL